MAFYVLKAYTMQNIFSSNTHIVMEVFRSLAKASVLAHFFANTTASIVDGYFFVPNSLIRFYGTHLTIYKSYISHFLSFTVLKRGWNSIDAPELYHVGELGGRH